ncbi:MFS transporter, partial [Sedimenticola sp.]|uniref:MFS transporter n=1 Tax=Sedimenticola sp. TaxID=1940285 RepID=UPI003D0A8057
MSRSTLNSQERRASLSLAAIFALRMLGLFMILPVFAIYAEGLQGVTPVTVGLAISAYGFSQAILQIPFGLLSDRFGRKPVIAFGLLLFAAGSVVAALATTIEGVIAGRLLQGSGAIAAAVMALAADLTRDTVRTRVMASIGASIGFAFLIALVAGPLLAGWVGVSGIFWLTAVLALAGIGVLYLAVPAPVRESVHAESEPVPAMFGKVLRDGQLLRMDAGIFILHMVLTAVFVAVPLLLRDTTGLVPSHHGLFYLGVMVCAIAIMVPAIIVGERRGLVLQLLRGAVLLLAVALLLIWSGREALWSVALAMVLFFAAFNILEASLPAIISRLAGPTVKGTAMGVYSSSQFLGAFVGGAAG